MSSEIKDIARGIASRALRRVAGELLIRPLSSIHGLEIDGLERIPSEGPAIIAWGPHTSLIDPLIPWMLLSQLPKSLGKKELFETDGLGKNILSWTMHNICNGIPVDRGEPDRGAVNWSLQALREGNYLSLTTDETRGRGEERVGLKMPKEGVGWLAITAASRLEKNIPISPWALQGADYVMPLLDVGGLPWNERIGERHRIAVSIAQPISVPPDISPRNKRREAGNITMEVVLAIRDMLPERYHGALREY